MSDTGAPRRPADLPPMQAFLKICGTGAAICVFYFCSCTISTHGRDDRRSFQPGLATAGAVRVWQSRRYEVGPPVRLELRSGHADASGNPRPRLPARWLLAAYAVPGAASEPSPSYSCRPRKVTGGEGRLEGMIATKAHEPVIGVKEYGRRQGCPTLRAAASSPVRRGIGGPEGEHPFAQGGKEWL